MYMYISYAVPVPLGSQSVLCHYDCYGASGDTLERPALYLPPPLPPTCRWYDIVAYCPAGLIVLDLYIFMDNLLHVLAEAWLVYMYMPVLAGICMYLYT